VDQSYSPRIVGTLRPDFHSLKTLLSSPHFAGKTGEDLVLAIYNHFTSTVDGTYHFWPSDERAGHPRIRRSVTDPIKLANAYGWMICGQVSHFLHALYRAAGLRARMYGVPGHALCEVFYDGRWHVLDVDMWTWFRTPAGHIASPYELASNARALILDNTNKSNPCNLPDRSLEDYANMYDKTETVDGHVKGIRPDWRVTAHNMDFHLRPGETLMRSQKPQGRFPMPQNWTEFKQKFAREWKRHPRERYEPFRTYGNGKWTYQPKLGAAYADFELGVWQYSGVTQDESGLVGAGQATFRVQSPYPFCGVPDWSDDARIVRNDGAWLSAAGSGPIKVQVTDAEGAWQTVLAADGRLDDRVDMTDLLDSRYECFVRLELGAGARLERFRFEGYVMTAPLTIPRLVEGDNAMELRSGDKHGLTTVPWSDAIDFRSSADLAARWERADNARVEPHKDDWQKISPEKPDSPVSVTYRFDAPPGRRFAWAYVLAIVGEGPTDQPPRKAMLEYSLDGKRFKPLAEIDISNTEIQWDTTIDGEVVFVESVAGASAQPVAATGREPVERACLVPVARAGAEPVERVWVRLTSATPIGGVEFYGHLAAAEHASLPVQVTHRWRDDEDQREFTTPPGATRYTITCGANPREHTIEMRVGSVQR